MKVSIDELKTVLSSSTQGRKKMNSTLFRNLVEKSEKVIFQGISFNKVTNGCNLANFESTSQKIHHMFEGD